MAATETAEPKADNFQPFETEWVPQIGKILRINAIHATIPPALLPKRVRVHGAWRRRFATTWREYFLMHQDGMITLPDRPGDGEPSMRQLLDWLKRQGYREVSNMLDDGVLEFEREDPR